MHPPSTTKSEILQKLVSARIEQAPPELRSWYGERGLRKQLSEFLDEDVDRTENQELAELFAHHCPVPGATASDYFNRWQPIRGLGWALIGIRFWSLDLDRPFVTVIASTELPSHQQVLAAAVEQLRHIYELFRPRHVRFFLPSHHPLQPTENGQYWEKRLLAAPIDDLLELPQPENYERVEIRRATDTINYPKYREAFAELLHSSPKHSEYTRLESEQDLAELARKGNLFEIVVDDSWAGTTAVDDDCEEGLKGYRMVEFLLKCDYRGKRLGTATQRHLVETLHREPGKRVLFGTIDARNQAPIRTARRLGRIDVGGYLWQTVDNVTDLGGV